MTENPLFDFVEEASSRTGDTAVIVLQSRRPPTEGPNAITELQGVTARTFALLLAAEHFGLPTPGINNSLRVYPVDDKGKPTVDEQGQLTSHGSPAGWQVSIPVMARQV